MHMRSLVTSLADRLLNVVAPRKTAFAACEPRTYSYCGAFSETCYLTSGGFYAHQYTKCQVLASCDERCSFVGCCL